MGCEDDIKLIQSTLTVIKRELDGPSSLLGYRGMWNKLQCYYPCDMVMQILRELDPDASVL